MMYGDQALKKLLRDYEFETVLDIGAGRGNAARAFARAGKKVTAIDLREMPEHEGNKGIEIIHGDFSWHDFYRGAFDCVWCCHVLEHQENVGHFLERISGALKVGGVLAITVPPIKPQIVSGHLSLWNAGLLLYRLAAAGINCRNAAVRKYDYNISVIVAPHMPFAKGQVTDEDLPEGLNWADAKRFEFDGEITELNW
jgi:SAM-dependent methyltransferase